MTSEPTRSKGDLAAQLASVPEDTVVRGVLEQALSVLSSVRDGAPLTMRLRAEAASASSALEAVAAGKVRELQRDLLATLAGSTRTAAIERTRWAGSDPNRPSGPDGYLHGVQPAGGSLCGLPAEALEVLRSRFFPRAIDACPDCARLSVDPTELEDHD